MSSSFSLAAVFGDHMVLQRDKPLTFWGRGQAGDVVTLEWESDEQRLTVETRVEASGDWRLSTPAHAAGGPYELSFGASERVTLRDVWVGEVWLASGQSNMEWTVAQSAFVDEEAALAVEPRLRWLFVERRTGEAPSRDARCDWRVVAPDTVQRMTAIGYAFARELCARLNVAVGVIDASWGGTPVEAWTSAEALAEVMDLRAALSPWTAAERDLEPTRQAYAEQLRDWERRCLVQDDGNQGEAWGWHRPEPRWDAPTLDVPTLWQRHGLLFNGAVWFRRELELPPDFTGAATLELGRIDDFDHTYVNGVLIGEHPQGTSQSCDIVRRYAVPAGVLRPGRNVISVRVFDHVGEGGFLDGGRSLFLLTSRGARYELAGPWQYRVEREVPLVPSSVWASYPRAPLALRPQDRPSSLYHGMISPLVGFALRGVIWYQGEANVAAHAHYLTRFSALIRDWQRRLAGASPLPVPLLFVQLASFRDNGEWPLLREAQARALRLPHTGMVVTLDVGDPNDIHPRNKREVGRRLARLALHQTYGLDVGPVRGPVPSLVQLLPDGAEVVYAEQAPLVTADGLAAVHGFELEDADGAVHAARAEIIENRVRVLSPFTARPKRVRYAFRDAPEVNLMNTAGLPAEPFCWPAFDAG